MGEDGKVVYKVIIDDSGVVDEAEKAGEKSASALENSANKGSKKYEEIMTGAARRVGEALVNTAMKAGRALINFGQDSIQLASDLQEVQNVVDVTFGNDASKINEWAKAAGEAFGLSELSALKYTSTLGAMFKSMGLGQNDVKDMSVALTGLAGDMASFYNLDAEDAFNKLRSGISGETEPLKQLGINLSQANLEAYALSQGITTAYGSMTQAEQATLRYQYILAVTADAQGDFARTTDSNANQNRLLQLEIEKLSADIGEALLPAEREVVGVLRDVVEWATNNKTTLGILGIAVATLTAAIIAYNASLALAASGMTLAGIAAGGLAAVMAFLTSPITLVVLAIGALIAAGVLVVKHWDEISAFFVRLWDGITNVFHNAVDAIGRTLSSWWESIKRFFSDGIKAVIALFNLDWASIGANIVRGIWEGISSLWGNLVKQVSEGVTNLWNSAKRALGIASPSKKFKYIGEMSVEGVEEGFDDNLPLLNRKVYTQFEDVGKAAGAGLSIPSMKEASRSFDINVAWRFTGQPIQVTVISEIDGKEAARSMAWAMGEQLAWEEL